MQGTSKMGKAEKQRDLSGRLYRLYSGTVPAGGAVYAHAREVVCTVTVDLRENPYEKCGIQHLFYMGRHTVCRLKELADRHQWK